MADVLALFVRYFFYLGLAFAAVLAVFLMPRWWLVLMAAFLVLCVVLGVAEGLGARWAKRVRTVLFWPNSR
ncbi:hypothetical protein [Thermomonas alba]|uniref:hypothetical protein n=1 Tax=Thermomonas alba TaxID=2888525 RepID=UPI001F04B310|nr:hypothetical protein [Thermomonas alba]